MFIPRQPTSEEVAELKNYLFLELYANPSDDDVNIDGWIDGAAIAVFDSYTTDSPGYCGKLIVVVWPAGPDCHEVFTLDEQGSLHKAWPDTTLQ